MTQEIQMPVEVIAALSELIHTLNPTLEDIGVIVILAKTEHPPTLAGTIPPEQMHDLFEWLLEHRDLARTEVSDLQTGESGSLN